MLANWGPSRLPADFERMRPALATLMQEVGLCVNVNVNDIRHELGITILDRAEAEQIS